MEMKEDLYELYIYWYFSNVQQFTTNFNRLTSIDILNQWTNVWFAKEEKQIKVDEYLRRYEYMIEKYVSYEPNTLIERISLVILYDQVIRNIFRGTGKAYNYDPIALHHAKELMEIFDQHPFCVKLTVILCFIHSENIKDFDTIASKIGIIRNDMKCDQKLFNALNNIVSRHRERVELFGRIPERNIMISRCSTEREFIYLKNI